MIEGMAALHISEAELARDLHAVLEQVRLGCEVVVERDHLPVAVMKPPDERLRTFSELIALATQREKERGFAVTFDEDYAADVAQIVRERKPWTPRSWE